MNKFREYFKESLSHIEFKEELKSIDLQLRIASLVKQTRKSKGLSQGELSDKSGISQCNISKIENGKYNLTVKQLDKILSALDSNIIFEVTER